MAKNTTVAYRNQVMYISYADNGYPELSFEPCREIPSPDGWFEMVWQECRNKEIYR